MIFYRNRGIRKLAKKSKKTELTPYLIGYARVSTRDQSLDLQLDALRKAGVKEDNLHVEKVSGAAKRRPALDLAIKDLRDGDTLLVWRLDRFARSMRDLYARLDQVYAKGAKFRSITESFDFDTFTGKFVLGILGLVAELERQIIAHRTSAGIEAIRAQGDGEWGRKPSLTQEQVVQAGVLMNRKNDPLSGPEAADRFDVSSATIYKYWQKNPRKGGPRFIRRRRDS